MKQVICLAMPLAMLLACAAASPALAQMQGGSGMGGSGMGGSGMKGPGGGKPEGEKKEPAPPPALPGAQSNADRAIPAGKPLSEMSPTDALFDSVERGNLVDAKDAVARGAELSARNALGQTPLETSVDLGHNDVTFYLLSMRSLDDTSGRGPPPPVKASARTKQRRTSPKIDTADAPANVEDPAVPAPSPRAGRYVASDGGHAVPQAGFLGFGGSAR